MYKWLCLNKLSLNISKTKFIIFHTSNKENTYIPIIEINNLKIDRVGKFNFLGVILDENLNWKDHINKISTKISRVTGILCKMKHSMPPFILKTIYNSLIVPHLTYGILVWGSNTSYLFKLQKKTIRTITKSKYNEHTEPLFKMLNLFNKMLNPRLIQINSFEILLQLLPHFTPCIFSSFQFIPQSK